MSKRMTSETIIFDTDWLTEADFEDEMATVSIDYQAYDTLKVIVDVPDVVLAHGGLFQEFDVYKLENQELMYRVLLAEKDAGFFIEAIHEDSVELIFCLNDIYWENNIKGLSSIYIKGVKR